MIAELPARRRETIIRALTDLHDVLRNHDNDTTPLRDSTQEVQRLLAPPPPRPL
jgi:hypothetical protein